MVNKTELTIAICIVSLFIICLVVIGFFSLRTKQIGKLNFNVREIPLDITKYTGPKGPPGDKGEVGLKGIQGSDGERGHTGHSGRKVVGIKGPQGDEGPAGRYPVIIPKPVDNITINPKATIVTVTITRAPNEQPTSVYIIRLYSKAVTGDNSLYVKEREKYNYPTTVNKYQAIFNDLKPSTNYKISAVHLFENRTSEEKEQEFKTNEDDTKTSQISLNPLPDIEDAVDIDKVDSVLIH